MNTWEAMRSKEVMLKIKTQDKIYGCNKSELLKCEVCEKYFKTEDYLASHGTRIYNNWQNVQE